MAQRLSRDARAKGQLRIKGMTVTRVWRSLRDRPERLSEECGDVPFVLTGFQQDNNVRRFTFESVGRGWPRTKVVVDADLGLVRKYRIPLQELPLLCLRLLERNADSENPMMFRERDMLEYANRHAEAELAAEQKRRARRPPVSSGLVGQAWRGTPVPKAER